MVPGFFGVLLEALGIFLGLDFWLHSIIPVTWNPEYPPWGLRTSLRGATFNKDDFLNEMTVLDETIVDFAPLVTRFEKQYAKKFLSCLTETVKQNGEQFETTTSSPGPLAQ